MINAQDAGAYYARSRAFAHRLLQRNRWIVADELGVRPLTERRQVDDAYTFRHRCAIGETAAVQEDDVEVFAERLGQRQRTNQVSEPQRMLAIEQQRRSVRDST